MFVMKYDAYFVNMKEEKGTCIQYRKYTLKKRIIRMLTGLYSCLEFLAVFCLVRLRLCLP